MAVLYLAKKYMVPSLAEKCMEYLHSSLDPSNIFSILPSAETYEEKNLVDQCWKVIASKQTEEAVKSDGFATIERRLLEAVVIRDTLTIEEIELFKAVDLWATKQCEKQYLAGAGATKRRILGEEVIKGIRFPIMRQEDFATVVLDNEILRGNEIVSVIKRLNSASTMPAGFPETKRTGFVPDIQRCCRFGSLSSYLSHYYEFRHDAINFYVDKDIELHGECLFGSKNNTYEVSLRITKDTSGTVLVYTIGYFYSKLLQSEKYSYHGFEVLFDEKVILAKNTTYRLFAKIRGPDSLCGKDGVTDVIRGNVTFAFLSKKGFKGYSLTDVQQGQFSEFLFALK